MAEHNELGKKGEAIAGDYLSKKGYRILHRNYRFKKGEIDLVCQFEDQLVVVEVKTRNSSYMAGPEETVTMNKQKAIIKVANAYIDEYEIDMETRFDIVSVIINAGGVEIEHLEDAFYPVI